MADDMIDRLGQARQAAVRALSDAEEHARKATAVAEAAMTKNGDLRSRLGSIKNPAPFIQQELEASKKAATTAVEHKKQAQKKEKEAQRVLRDLDRAIEQLQAVGIRR